MDFNQEIGKRLRDLREKLIIDGKTCSQDKIIELLGLNISQNTLSQIEKGKKATPAYDILIKYSQYFNISLDALITGKEFQPKQEAESQYTFADILKAFFLIDEYYNLEIIYSSESDEGPEYCIKSINCCFSPGDYEVIQGFLRLWKNVKDANLKVSGIGLLDMWETLALEDAQKYTADFKYHTTPIGSCRPLSDLEYIAKDIADRDKPW